MITFAYPFALSRILDGDTVEGAADLGFYISRRVIVRLNGINAPETHGTEKPAGILVKSCAERWFADTKADPKSSIWLVSKEIDKYGRVLGEIEIRTADAVGWTAVQPMSLNKWLLSTNLVQPYNGNLRHPYTADELNAIIIVAQKILK